MQLRGALAPAAILMTIVVSVLLTTRDAAPMMSKQVRVLPDNTTIVDVQQQTVGLFTLSDILELPIPFDFSVELAMHLGGKVFRRPGRNFDRQLSARMYRVTILHNARRFVYVWSRLLGHLGADRRGDNETTRAKVVCARVALEAAIPQRG